MLNLPNFSKNKNLKTETTPREEVIVLDIGTEYVKASVFSLNESNVEILGCGLKEFGNLDPALLNNEDFESIEHSAKNALEKALSFSNTNTKNVIIGIPSLNICSQTTTIRVKRPKAEVKISAKEIEEITSKLIAKSKNEALEFFQKKHKDFKGDIDVINSDITFVKIDGYITKELEGFRGNVLEISFFTTFAPSAYIENLVKLSRKLNLQLITIVPNIYALNKVISGKDNANHIIIDTGGKNTDVAIVFGEEILKIISFKLGIQSFINYIHTLVGEDKDKIVNHLISDENESSLKLKFEIEQVWIENVVSLLESIEGIKAYPETILLSGGGAKIISKELLKEGLNQIKFKNDPKIRILTDESFAEVFINNLNETKIDLFLNSIAVALFAKKIL